MADTRPKTDAARTDAQSEPERRPARWLPLLIAAVAACLVAGCSYYALKFFRGSTVNDERAFRALGEITGQFDNLQDTMGSLLQLVPARANLEPNVTARYLASLALEGLQLDVEACTAATNPTRPAFAVEAQGSSRHFSVRRCLSGRNLALSGDLLQHLPTFIVQEFFDDVILATREGRTVAQIHGRSREETRVELQDARADGLTIPDATTLLQHASEEEGASRPHEDKSDARKEAKPAGTNPSRPVVFDDVIAGEDYRVFVQPFEARYPVAIDGKEHATLYLIGVRHQNILQSLSAALGPSGRLAITILVLLTILGWPLLSLKFSSAQDPISPAQVIAVVIALLLIPAVLAVIGFSTWSSHRLRLWADRASETYAYQLERELLQELSDDTQLLDRLANDYAKSASLTDSTTIAQLRQQLGQHAGAWPRLHNTAALDQDGRSFGVALDLYELTTQPRALDLHDREYFKAVRAEEEWRPAGRWQDEQWKTLDLQEPANGFVAQRLFNRTDAARVLQLAVPRIEAGKRTGVITGDSRAYALTTSLRPPLLRFAIVDSNSGTVLFHSNDKRSLAENLLVETQANASLRTAMSKRASRWSLNRIAQEDHFDGNYMGEPQRFYYRPVSGVPWGIVVFYSNEPIGVAVLQTANATLATYFACAAVVILLVSGIIVAVSGRPDLELLAWIWPQWRRYTYYGSFALCMIAALALCATFAIGRLNGAGYSTIFLALIVVAAGSLLLARMRGVVRNNSVQRWQNEFVSCMVCVMCIVAVVPTLWLAVDYHDASVKALIGDELKQAGDDVEHRYRVMARDLRHSSGDSTAGLRMDARIFSNRPVPGFSNGCVLRGDRNSMVWEVTAFPTDPWLTQGGPPALGMFRRLIWLLSTDRHLQRAWVDNDIGDPSAVPEKATACDLAATRHAVSSWSSSDDGYRIKVALPVSTSDSGAVLKRDRELTQLRYSWSSEAVLIAGALALLLSLTLLSWHAARRLFGIRIPFSGRFVDAPRQLNLQPLLQAELDLLDLKTAVLEQDPSAVFTPKDESDWRAVHCLSVYQDMWQALSVDERLLLHQLARGKFVNPENSPVIEQLLRRGYLKLRPWPRIVESGFAEFARTAETEQKFADWQRAASRNLWTGIRIPLFIIVVVITAALMWLAGSAMQILSTTLAGVATLFGVIAQVTNFVRKDGKPASS